MSGQFLVLPDCRTSVSYTHLRAHETRHDLVCRLLLEKKFSAEVNAYILFEKIEKSLTGNGTADPQTLREGRDHLNFHLNYMTWLLERRDWLSGGTFTLADIAGAAHLSCLDFLGEIQWRDWPDVKRWYQTIKSRPSFQPLLHDNISGLRAARHYRDLDF